MTLRHFQIFASVADTLNMTASAEILFMSQSAVSQAISQLEKHYGVRLFERFSKKLFLTRAGERLLGYARHIVSLNLDVERELRELNESGWLRIGASVTIGAYVLPDLVYEFKKTNPQTALEVVEDNTEQVERLLLQDEIDIGIVEGETKSLDMINIPFMEDELVLICANSHRFASLGHIGAEELEKEEFIIRERGSGTRQTFEDGMAQNGLSCRISWTCNNADTIKMAVAKGLGVSVISRRAVQGEIADGLLCEVGVDGILFRRQFKLIYHRNKFLTEQIQRFMSLCTPL